MFSGWQQVAYLSEQDENREIYVMNADGTNKTNLTNNTAQDYLGSWSLDGQSIVFSSDRDADGEIYVMTVDGGTELEKLTDNEAIDSRPLWSPDGTKIAFISNRGNSIPDRGFNVFIMDLDGSEQTKLTTTEPASAIGYSISEWSSDGTRILGTFKTTSLSLGSVATVRVSGDGPTFGGGAMVLPTWAQDGNKILSIKIPDTSLFVTYSNGTTKKLQPRTYDAELGVAAQTEELFCGKDSSEYNVIEGTAGDDLLYGTAGNDLILGQRRRRLLRRQ